MSNLVVYLKRASTAPNDHTAVPEYPAQERFMCADALHLWKQDFDVSTGELPVLISTRLFQTATSVANRRIMPPPIKVTAPTRANARSAIVVALSSPGLVSPRLRFRKTWLRGARCLEDLNNFWMAHKPQTMSEVYSHLHEETELRLQEAERVGYGFDLPRNIIAPNAPKISTPKVVPEIAA